MKEIIGILKELAFFASELFYELIGYLAEFAENEGERCASV